MVSFLSHRIVQVKLGKSKSTTGSIRSGVPQGFVMTLMLYKICSVDIPIHGETKLAQFLDDITFTGKTKVHCVPITLDHIAFRRFVKQMEDRNKCGNVPC